MEWLNHIFIFVFLFRFTLSQHCEKDRCDDGEPGELKKCKYFDPTQFNEDSPSIVYGKITYTVHFVHACDIYTAATTTKNYPYTFYRDLVSKEFFKKYYGKNFF